MEITIYSVLYTLGIGLFGYFLRDIYNYIKKRTLKGTKPKTILNHSYRHKYAVGTNPRVYTFESKIVFKNIDTEPVYDITINQKIERELIRLKYLENLIPNDEIIIADKIDVPHGHSGNETKEAEKKLPEKFTNPDIEVSFKNKNGHKFKAKLNDPKI